MDTARLCDVIRHAVLTGHVLIRRDGPTFLHAYTTDPKPLDRLGPQD